MWLSRPMSHQPSPLFMNWVSSWASATIQGVALFGEEEDSSSMFLPTDKTAVYPPLSLSEEVTLLEIALMEDDAPAHSLPMGTVIDLGEAAVADLAITTAGKKTAKKQNPGP